MAPDESTQLFAAIDVDRGVLRARLVGPSIGQREGPVIAGMIQSALNGQDQVAWVVLDFSDVTFLNSAGIGSCVSIRNDAAARKVGVVLHGMQDNILDVFRMTRLDKIFKVANDEKRLAKIVGR